MSPDAEPRFHILVDDPGILASRLGDVARAIAKALKVPRTDAAQRVRYGAGIVGRDLPEPATDEILASFGQEGIGAFAIPSPEVEPLPRTLKLAGLAFVEGGLVGTFRGTDRREEIAWDRVRAFHVTVVARERSADEVEEGRTPRPLYDVTTLPPDACRLSTELDFWEDRERTRKLELALDLLAQDPVLVARISAEDADYATLAEGKALSSLANFLLFVRALAARAPAHVVVPPATRAFAENASWKDLLVEKPEQREAQNLWLLHASRYGRAYGGATTAKEAAEPNPEPEAPAAPAPADPPRS